MNQFLSLLHKSNLALANWNHLLWFSKREELVETRKGPFFLNYFQKKAENVSGTAMY